MTNRNDILNELNGFESSLTKISSENIYSVPDSYFENLSGQILRRIKALDTSTPKEELKILSTLLLNGKQNPFSVPIGYFENLSDKIMSVIHTENQTSEQELKNISPLLSSIGNTTPYSVPAGYFENLDSAFENKKTTKVVSFTGRRWFRLAAAASVIGVISIGALLFLNQKSITPINNPQAWVKKNVSKKVSPEKLDEFVKLTSNEDNQSEISANEFDKSEEIKDLIKDVSEKELQDFLNDAVALESNDESDVLMN